VPKSDTLVVTSHDRDAIEERCAAGRLGAAGSLVIVLVLVFCGCSPAERDSVSERAAGVSVAEHWATLLEVEDSLERSAALAKFVTTLGPEDSDAVGDLVTDRFRRHRSVDDLILMNAWSRLDPERAIAVAKVAQSPAAEAVRVDTALEWALRDPTVAIAAVGIDESALRRVLVRGWYESGTPGLSDYVLAAGASREGQGLIASYAAELRNDKGVQGIVEWLDSVRGRRDLDQIMIIHAHRKGIAEMAVGDAEMAIAYCDTHCDEPYADSARARLIDRLGLLEQAERALAWLEAAEDANQDERGRAARFAFRAWLRYDRDAAMAWADEGLGKYGDQVWFVPLARVALSIHTRREPETALEWIEVLPEGQNQEDALIKIARRWGELDENAAEVWLETSPLDDEARAKARTPAVVRKSGYKPKPKANPMPDPGLY
jgi:hypothetical protein